ncbi:MAG: D-glycero-beta-D-manno-heptose-7-phosphate kinase [Bacteroidetes bacterium]|nr:D-glycero-beta-D-manno-heptose-7-phosphate kinase [Bacteroidota bacterium]
MSSNKTEALPLRPEQATSLLDQFGRLRILVIGDVMLDAYIFGKVERISPEAPVPVVSVRERTSRLGGAANVALNLHALGAEPVMISVVGNDVRGSEFIELCERYGMHTGGILRLDDRPTTTKFRIIGNNVQMLRVDEETTRQVDTQVTTSLVERVAREIAQKNVDAIVFQDYDKGVIDNRLIAEVVSMAREHHIPVAVDPKKRHFLDYRKVSLFKPNLKELREGMNYTEEITMSNLSRAVELLQEKLEADMVMVTLSEKGVYIRERNENAGQGHHLPAFLRNIADVSGAGDTVISVAAVCLALGQDARTTAFLSNLAGGLVCEEVGVVPVDKTKLRNELLKVLQ